MTRLTILSPDERKTFDSPPVFNETERQQYLTLTPEIKSILNALQTPTSQVGFLLQLAYFQKEQRFYSPKLFRTADIEFAALQLKIEKTPLDWPRYKERIIQEHRRKIRRFFDVMPFNNDEQTNLENEVSQLAKLYVHPKEMLYTLIDKLKSRRIEVPGYYLFSVLITKAYHQQEKKVLAQLKLWLTQDLCAALDKLLDKAESDNTAYATSLLATLKGLNQSIKPRDIRESLQSFSTIQSLYAALKPLYQTLDLPIKAIQYYGLWVHKAESGQLQQFVNPYKRYLHLIAFIHHHYYLRQDNFVDIFQLCVRHVMNSVEKAQKNHDFQERLERNQVIEALAGSRHSFKEKVMAVKTILGLQLSDSEKVSQIKTVLAEEVDESTLEPLFEKWSKQARRVTQAQDRYPLLEEQALWLQNRVAGLLKVLVFDLQTAEADLLSAIHYYQTKDVITKHAPQAFLSEKDRKALQDEAGRFKVSLYKTLLFIYTAQALKSGRLNLQSSYHYLSIERYLIPKEQWRLQQAELLKQAQLGSFSQLKPLLKHLETALDKQYRITNQRIKSGKNPHFTIDEQQAMKLKTPKIEKARTTKIAQLLAESGFVSILDILETVEQATGFLDGFKHYSIKHSKPRPSPRVFFAAIIGEGCNFGSHKLAQISRGVSRTVLDNVINWYFDKDSLARANQRLIALIDKLHLPTLFKKEAHLLHTSSDGKKHLIRVDSLNANYSFKYFGSGKGVSIYHFLDERSLLFHVPVISSAEREAGYVVDGLAHNQGVKSDIHSTDTHGFSEIIFAITYFLGIIFAPRIKKVLHQQLYAFKSKKHYTAKGYVVLPDRYADIKRIEDNWEDMLRLIATIKLKHATASQIFKRLSSYSKEHPLYQAFKAFGRIIKSLFILEYIDDVELRQAIQKQLNKVELSHKFSNAVFFADNQEFKQSTPEEQARAAGCKCLIQNAIVVWNYLYLSNKLANCSDAKEKTTLLKSLKKGSIMTWHHANLHGEYDFTEKPAASNIQFDLDKILALRLD